MSSGNATLTLGPGTFFPNAPPFPTQFCNTITRSFVENATTLLPPA